MLLPCHLPFSYRQWYGTPSSIRIAMAVSPRQDWKRWRLSSQITSLEIQTHLGEGGLKLFISASHPHEVLSPNNNNQLISSGEIQPTPGMFFFILLWCVLGRGNPKCLLIAQWHRTKQNKNLNSVFIGSIKFHNVLIKDEKKQSKVLTLSWGSGRHLWVPQWH